MSAVRIFFAKLAQGANIAGFIDGAGRENRTLMTLRSQDFESCASTNSAIPAGKSPQIIRQDPIIVNSTPPESTATTHLPREPLSNRSKTGVRQQHR
jgi:hypothetical protein